MYPLIRTRIVVQDAGGHETYRRDQDQAPEPTHHQPTQERQGSQEDGGHQGGAEEHQSYQTACSRFEEEETSGERESRGLYGERRGGRGDGDGGGGGRRRSHAGLISLSQRLSFRIL